MINRQAKREGSNNPNNNNQNVCALAVARSFGVATLVRYLHTWSDIKRALGMRYRVRSRLSQLRKAPSVGNSRAQIKSMILSEGAAGAVAHVEGHVLSWDSLGNLTDTAPRLRDRRKLIHLYILLPKGI